MKRVVFSIAIVALFVASRLTFGQGNPFIDHSDTGETVHVLPPEAAIHSPHDTQPTIAPVRPGLSVYGASYGSGNLLNHGGHQISSAGFFAIYWNGTVANAGGSITVDVSTTAAAAAVLHLADTTITSGTVSDRGALFLDGADLIQSGSLGNSATGQIQVTTGSNTLHNETVTNAGAIEVLAGTVPL